MTRVIRSPKPVEWAKGHDLAQKPWYVGFMQKYMRVIPRDLFNESKLLKCLGKLSVYVLDRRFPYEVLDDLEDSINGFKIVQDEDGNIYCKNYKFLVLKDNKDHSLSFYTPLNSKRPFPLYCDYIEVLDDEGRLTDEFIVFLHDL